MRKTICRSSWLSLLAAGAALAPATALAQADSAAMRADSASRAVHVVRRGDTLWDLAVQYLRDPYRWPELYQANRAVVENPNLIYPGERLRIPGAAMRAVADASAAPASADATVGVIRLTGTGDADAPASMGDRSSGAEAAAARRLADYLSAPYVGPVGGTPGAGRIRSTSPRFGESETRFLQLGDPVRVRVPQDAQAEVGARFVSYRLAEKVGSGQVIQPSGIIEVTDVDGADVRGRIIAVLGLLEADQRLMSFPPLPTQGAGSGASGSARVVWVENGALLPTLQDWVVLAPASGAMISEGDDLELVRDVAGADAAPEIVGHVHVVRVTPHGASAVITHVQQAGIGVGSMARAAGPR